MLYAVKERLYAVNVMLYVVKEMYDKECFTYQPKHMHCFLILPDFVVVTSAGSIINICEDLATISNVYSANINISFFNREKD